MSKVTYGCLVFYDFEPKKVDLKSLYELGINFFSQHEQIPLRMGLHGQNIKQSSKTKTFKYYNKLIYQQNFNYIESLWMGGGYPEKYDYDDRDCYIGFDISMDKFLNICLYYNKKEINVDKDSLLLISQSIIKSINPQYGFYFQAPSCIKSYPHRYVIGLQVCDLPKEEDQDMENWKEAYRLNNAKTYKTGDLRNIYPINFIGSAHLNRLVNGKPLKFWIDADPSRGTLTPFTNDLWLWEVNSDNIPMIREALKPYDILICFRDWRTKR